ncbi:MAG TPA: molybdate ABC transporter substrate-binding protein [Casimicrobiaceae bacterium]|nr:molybdate ABC transporter substrate-binding protein [Casimicrobiaceae bacterium]
MIAASIAPALAVELEVFHADSLAGPMRELQSAYEAKHPGITLKLTAGVSKQLAERVLKGEACDVFAPSSPAVIDDELLGKPVGAAWYIVFSANEMVVITAKGNPLNVRDLADIAKPGMRVSRVTGEKDLATGRTVEFLKREAAREGRPEFAQQIADKAPIDPSKPVAVPDVVSAVRQGGADAGIVYYSAAVAARGEVGIVRFPESVNLSEAIRNAAAVPGTARHPQEATAFVAYLISPEAQEILRTAGQPPVSPALRRGAIPSELR